MIHTRYANAKDIPMLIHLLEQVNLVHHIGRPDLFKKETKYDETGLENILSDPTQTILVACDETDTVLGYGFCVFTTHMGERLLEDHTTCYIDDICVDETARRKGVGTAVYNAIVTLAKEKGCHNITLNVWSINESARKFYESLGMGVQKTVMETILDS